MRGRDAEGSPVRVWVLPIEVARPVDVRHLLDRRELARRERFHRPVDALRFTAGHALLRLAAADGLGCPPSSVRLGSRCPGCGSGEHGRPVVEGMDDAPFLSLAHSGDVVVAATAAGPVGIDVEACRPDVDALELARLTMSPAEIAALADLGGADRVSLFYRLWVLKEAVLKAAGLSLSDLSSVEVMAAVSGRATIEARGTVLSCRPLTLPAPSGVAAAIAATDLGAEPDLIDAVGPYQALGEGVAGSAGRATPGPERDGTDGGRP